MDAGHVGLLEAYFDGTIDLDLLLYGDEVIRTPALVVPHPALVARRFVLAPLAELCPERVVPGTALGTLVANGVYPDPYFGLNNLFIPDTLCRQVYVYRLDFPTPELNGRGATLIFNGVNYAAEYILSGQ